jgi:hypothetical protein
MIFSTTVCVASFLIVLKLLRKDKVSLGLPVAYMFQLLLIHVPGAFVHIVGGDLLANSDLTATGIQLAAIGSVCYVVGVWVARASIRQSLPPAPVDRRRFYLFCLLGGWCATYGLGPLRRFPSVGALIEQGGFIWMFGVMLGLRFALRRGDRKWILIWLGALVVYPVLMLVLGGFVSWGSMAAIIVLAALTVSTRSYTRVLAGMTAAILLGLAVFVTYFQHRNEIRDQVWGGASIEARVNSVVDAFSHFEWFDTDNRAHLDALDQRLNQNYFAGLAADRLARGEVDYLYGATIWDGVLAVIPRALWPEKPVTAGSGRIVANMTGLDMPEGVSFGVGNVMEFDINFGIPGLIIGFLLLGWVTGKVDYKAARAEREGELSKSILYFLPAVALMSPIGSLVDLSSAYVSGLVAAVAWARAWKYWSRPRGRRSGRMSATRAASYESLTYSN